MNNNTNRVVIKTTEDSVQRRSQELPLEIGVVLSTPAGRPLTAIRISSERELIKYFGEPTGDYPVYDTIRSFIRRYYGVTLVRVPLADSIPAKVVVTDASDAELFEVLGVSHGDFENGLELKFSQDGEKLSYSLVKRLTDLGEGVTLEVMRNLPSANIAELVSLVNSTSNYLTFKKVESSPDEVPDLSKTFKLEGGVSGSTVDPEDVIKALDVFSGSSITRCDVLVAPGLNGTDKKVPQRGEAVAAGRDETMYLTDFYRSDRVTSVDEALEAVVDLPQTKNIASYYPDVRMQLQSGLAVVPASAAVLFTYANASLVNAWTAPAGYDLAMAIPGAVSVTHILTSEEEIKLYEGTESGGSVNPITYDTKSGFIVNGIRTGAAPSAYTRSISTTKMSNYLHYEVREVTKRYMYKPNSDRTWDSWILQMTGILDLIMAADGISTYEVLMGEETMTQEEVDAGILKGLVRVRPTSSIEYIEITVSLEDLRLVVATNDGLILDEL